MGVYVRYWKREQGKAMHQVCGIDDPILGTYPQATTSKMRQLDPYAEVPIGKKKKIWRTYNYLAMLWWGCT
jgi:hypothetical protein